MILAAAWDVLSQEFGDLPDQQESIRVAVRLVLAIVLGGVLGWERQHEHKPAGMRTHIIVTLAAAMLILVAQRARMTAGAISRVLQGLVTVLVLTRAAPLLAPS